MTPRAILEGLQAGSLPGRHVLVVAHPDDETISCAALLCAVTDPVIVQLTDGVPPGTDRDVTVACREAERAAAMQAAGWPDAVRCGCPGRDAYAHAGDLLVRVRAAVQDADVVWTHPYEGGHVDHDTAAWLVQQAWTGLRMEFASYHQAAGVSVFGQFWPLSADVITLTGSIWARKQAALAAYGSQAHILRKFPRVDQEVYRAAPVYDFTRLAPVPSSRWDLRSYTPSTATWRKTITGAA